MTEAGARMWGEYLFRGHRVRVIQQWRDPFGRRMVRVELTQGEGADGFAEDAFLHEAELCDP